MEQPLALIAAELTPSLLHWLPTFPESPAKITPSLLKSLSRPFLAKDKWTEDTTLTPRPNAKFSTFAPLTDKEVCPSTPSSAPMEPSSTRTTSSATGGSTLTAPKPKASTASTTTLLPNELPLPDLRLKHPMELPLKLLKNDSLLMKRLPPCQPTTLELRPSKPNTPMVERLSLRPDRLVVKDVVKEVAVNREDKAADPKARIRSDLSLVLLFAAHICHQSKIFVDECLCIIMVHSGKSLSFSILIF